MENNFDRFLALHQKDEPLLLGNVWNVQSAKIFERQKFQAVATSSAAIAATLGYADNQEMSFEEHLFMIRHIAAGISIPLSVDLEAGYGDSPEAIYDNIVRLYDAGIAGLNIEDSVVIAGQRKLLPAWQFAEKLQRILSLLDLDNIKMFMNLRCDSFLMGVPDALEDALSRIALYKDTGVHGLFLPCITAIDDIKKVTASTRLPVNVMCMPDLPDFKQLQRAGVKRISMGSFLNEHLYQGLDTSIGRIVEEGSFDSLFRPF